FKRTSLLRWLETIVPTPAVYVLIAYSEIVLTDGGGPPVPPAARVAVLELVSLNRKKSFTLSLTAWSNRTLVELIELGLDQLPMNWPIPFLASSSPFGLGTGKASIAGRSALAAGCLWTVFPLLST